MLLRPLLAGAAMIATVAPVLAQSADGTGRPAQEEYQRGYAATPMPGQAAIDAQSRPAVAALNGQAEAQQVRTQEANAAQVDANRAQYDADRAAYLDALVRHDASVDRADVRWRRQQNAYADAMAAWRGQVAACKAGHRRACDMPAPNPADYY